MSDFWPTYLMLALYVLVMIIVSVVANRQNVASASAEQSKDSEVKAHFLASKSFGVPILLLTTFASLYSGYTVVGVPNEAGANGFASIRWISIGTTVVVGFLVIFPRFRRISVARNYGSPGDFLLDRFRSTPLRVIGTLCLCVPQLLYITVQLHALGATISFFTDGELDFDVVVCVSALIILILEALGGMRTVAYTDAVQAVVMMIIFVCFPIVIASMYNGGFSGMVTDDADGCANFKEMDSGNGTMTGYGCLGLVNGPYGADIASEFYLRTPASLTTTNFLLFAFSLMSFALNPHILQRAMAAQHDWQLRAVVMAIGLSPWLCMTPGILIGVAYLANYPETQYPYYPAFQATLAMFRDDGGFKECLGYIATLAAVAGIMSTADSALIGVSNTVTIDLFKNWLLPELSATHVVWIGKVISLVVLGISIGMAIDLQNTAEAAGESVSYGTLLTLQGGILWQAFPAYALGLHTNVSSKAVLMGMCGGIFVFLLLAGLLGGDDSPFVEHDAKFETLDASWTAFAGVGMNLVLILIGHFVFGPEPGDDMEAAQPTSPGSEEAQEGPQAGQVNSATADSSEAGSAQRWNVLYNLKNPITGDQAFGSRLSVSRIKSIMAGIQEPVYKYYGALIWACPVLLCIAAFHWIGAVDPALEEQYGEEGVTLLLYNGEVRSVVGGMPDWAFASIMWFVVATFCGLAATYQWGTDAVDDDAGAVEMEKATSASTAETGVGV